MESGRTFQCTSAEDDRVVSRLVIDGAMPPFEIEVALDMELSDLEQQHGTKFVVTEVNPIEGV